VLTVLDSCMLACKPKKPSLLSLVLVYVPAILSAEPSSPTLSRLRMLLFEHTFKLTILTLPSSRGDRFLTTDFTPQNFTVWGFQDCQRDINNGGFGGILSKILMRTLPEHYTFNSVYALFPFLVPQKMKEHLTDMNIVDLYDCERPKESREVVSVNSYAAVRAVLSDSRTYPGTYVEHMKHLTDGYGFFLAMDDQTAHQKDMSVVSCLTFVWCLTKNTEQGQFRCTR
jgi:hypothetical protein